MLVRQPLVRDCLDEQRRRRPLAGPRPARVVERVVDPRERPVRPGVALDRRELPVRVPAARIAVEAQHRELARQSQHRRQVLVRLLLPAGAPDEVEIGAERLQVPGRGGRNQVGRPVDEHPGTRWTLIGRESEERDDAIDVDQEHRFAGVLRQSRGNRRTWRGVPEYPMHRGSVNPVGAGADDKDSPRLPSPHRSRRTPPSMTLQLGILFALLCAIGSNLAFFFKHRGACVAPSVDIRRPLHTAGRALVVEVVRDRHGRRRPRLAAARRGARARADVHRPGGRRRRRRADRRDGRPDLRHEGQPPPVVGPGPDRRRPRAARRDDAGADRLARLVLARPDDRLRGRAARHRRAADRRPARGRRPRRAPRRRARDRLRHPLRRLQRLREGALRPGLPPRRSSRSSARGRPSRSAPPSPRSTRPPAACRTARRSPSSPSPARP